MITGPKGESEFQEAGEDEITIADLEHYVWDFMSASMESAYFDIDDIIGADGNTYLGVCIGNWRGNVVNKKKTLIQIRNLALDAESDLPNKKAKFYWRYLSAANGSSNAFVTVEF